MKWSGETEQQWERRVSEWHRVFCWFPTQMRNGRWVWLDHCWAICRWNGHKHFWEFSDSVFRPEDFRPTGPAPRSR